MIWFPRRGHPQGFWKSLCQALGESPGQALGKQLPAARGQLVLGRADVHPQPPGEAEPIWVLQLMEASVTRVTHRPCSLPEEVSPGRCSQHLSKGGAASRGVGISKYI